MLRITHSHGWMLVLAHIELQRVHLAHSLLLAEGMEALCTSLRWYLEEEPLGINHMRMETKSNGNWCPWRNIRELSLFLFLSPCKGGHGKKKTFGSQEAHPQQSSTVLAP